MYSKKSIVEISSPKTPGYMSAPQSLLRGNDDWLEEFLIYLPKDLCSNKLMENWERPTRAVRLGGVLESVSLY